MPRTYSQDEVREIIRRAADATAEKERKASEDTGFSLDDLRDLAASSGIDPDVMAEAARSLDREVVETFEKRVVGVKTSAAHAVWLEGPFTDDDWQALVADCRTTFAAKGKVHNEAGLREWSNGNLHVLVEPAGDDVIIRMRTHYGAAERMLTGGIAASVAFSIMVLSALSDGKALGDIWSSLAIVLAAFLAAGGFLFSKLKNWSRTRESQMNAIGRRMEQRKDTKSGVRARAIKASSSERIDLPDESDAEQEAVHRIRRKER